MSQIKIYALNETIEVHRIELIQAIHQALIKELSYLEENIFQRFIPLESEILFIQRIDLDFISLSRFQCLKEERRDQKSIYLGFN